MPIVLKCGSLNLLETSGPVQACNGIALPLPLCTYVHKRTTELKKNDYGRISQLATTREKVMNIIPANQTFKHGPGISIIFH